MTPDDLRALADALAEYAESPDRVSYQAEPILRAADYLRAQADAQPVAWLRPENRLREESTSQTRFSFGKSRPSIGTWQPLYARPAQAAAKPCWCHKCNEGRLVNGIPFAMTQMIVCPICGNKRCPHASDHALACTASNDSMAVSAAPKAEPCVGNDPTCPCQDGDACHYRDADGIKAWPAPQTERTCTCAPEDNPPIPCARKYAFTACMQAQAEPKLGELMLEQRRSRVVAGAYPDGNPNAGAMMAQTSQAEPIDPHMIAAEDRFPDDDGPVILGEPDVLTPDDVRRVTRRAEPKRPQTCLWSRSDDDTDVWETACGNAFTINEGGAPADNEMTFCCFCGRELKGEIGDSDAE